MYFSAQAAGFYDPAIHGTNIPNDAVEITREEHAALIAGEAAGQFIAADDDGRPTLQDRPKPTAEALTASKRSSVDLERTRRIDNGSTFEVSGIDDPIPLTGRPFDQTVYLAMLSRAQAYKLADVTTPILTIRDAANVNHLLTPDQMLSLISQAMIWFQDVMQVSWNMKDGTAEHTGGIPDDFADDKHWP